MKLAIFWIPIFLTGVFATPVPRGVLEKEQRRALTWLYQYNYYQGEHGQVDDIPAHKLAEVIQEPLKECQEIYGFTPDGVLTDEVMRMMEKPRCGDVDIPLRSTQQQRRRKRWSRLSQTTWNNMPVTITFKNYSTRHRISSQTQRDIMTECAEMWSIESGISFKLLASGVGDIDVSFKYMDGMWGQVGTALSPTPFWPDKPSPIQLDLHERWKPRRESANRWYVSMKWAMCHELGHAIGIGHSSIRQAIMFARGEGQYEKRLHLDDRSAVKSLYGDPDEKTLEVEWDSKYHPNRHSSTSTTKSHTTPTSTETTTKTTTMVQTTETNTPATTTTKISTTTTSTQPATTTTTLTTLAKTSLLTTTKVNPPSTTLSLLRYTATDATPTTTNKTTITPTYINSTTIMSTATSQKLTTMRSTPQYTMPQTNASNTNTETTNNVHQSTTLTLDPQEPGSPHRFSLNQFYRDNVRFRNGEQPRGRSGLLTLIQRRRG